MKTAFLFFTILVLFFTMKSNAAAPYGFKGQGQASTLYSNVVQFPNNSVTNLGGINALVETGNNNLLVNPGFEAPMSGAVPGWTLENPGIFLTADPELSNVRQGKQSLRITATSEVIDFRQTSTINATAFADGVNGSISISVRTNIDNMYLCQTNSAGAVVANTNGTKITNCVKAPNNSKWSELSMPIILGATQNGMRLVSLTPSTAVAVAVTGTIDLDDARLETGSKTSSQTVCRDISCMTEFSAKIDSAGTVSDESAEWITGNCAVSGTSIYTCTPKAGMFTVAPTCVVAANPGAFLNFASMGNTTSASSVVYRTSNYTGVAQAQNATIICQKQGVDFSTAQSLANGNTYSSSCGANCVDTFTAYLNGTTGAVSGANSSGWIVYSSGAATATRVYTFPSGLFSAAPNCFLTTTSNAIQSGISTLTSSTVSVGTASSAGSGSVADTWITCSKTGADFIANRTIVGSFAEVVTSPLVTKPVEYSFVFGTTGIVTLDDSDLVSGNCTNANPSVCTYNAGKFSSNPVCVLTADNVDRTFRVLSSLSTSASFTMFVSSTGSVTALDTGAHVICKGKLP